MNTLNEPGAVMNDLLTHVEAQFPLMRLELAAGNGAGAEPLPRAMYFVLAAMESWNDGPICFVLPRSGPMGHAAALIYALGRFVREYPAKVLAHSQANFAVGQRVRVLPNNRIYAFGGQCDFNPGRIWLAEVDNPTSRVSFPIAHVLRLQKTEALRPHGKINHDVHTAPADSPLDMLLGIKTFGNRSLFSNQVLYLEHQNAFRAFLDSVTLKGTADIHEMPTLSGVVPCGTIEESGALRKWDEQSSDGEPLIAVTSSLPNLAAVCCNSPVRTKVVLANGVDLLSDLQAYDDIACRQRLVLLAEPRDAEVMSSLAARVPPCRFWHLGDILAHEAEPDANPGLAMGSRLFGPVHMAARNTVHFQIEKQDCSCPELDGLASILEKLNAGMSDSDDDPLRGLARRLFGLLMSSAELVEPPCEEGRDRLTGHIQTVLEELDRNSVWIDRKYADIIRTVCHDFKGLTDGNSGIGKAKGTAVQRVLAKCDGARAAIVARNHNQAEHIHAWAAARQLVVPVVTPTGIEDDRFFDVLILPTWIGSAAFSRLHDLYAAPKAVFTGYAFELHWLGQWRNHMRRKMRLPVVDGQARSRLLGIGSGVKVHWPDIEPSTEADRPTREVDKSAFDIWAFENRVKPARKGSFVSKAGDELTRAKYVGFVGNSYAYVTESHELAVVTDLLDTQRSTKTAVPMKRVSELRHGDFVVFREGGEKDVIQTIADRLMGAEAEKTRRLSRLWAEELRKSALTPSEIHAKMRGMGAVRCLVTIRSWLNDEGRIGPEQKSDLDLIERVTGSEVLRERKDAVWAAITEVRSQHLSAGMRLSSFLLKKLPDCVTAVEDGGSRVNVEDMVSAWIVQVEETGEALEDVPRSLVNALRWEEEPEP